MIKTKKAQTTGFFMVVIATIIVITMITVNIGKIARDKAHTENSADAGALAAGSVAAYTFNYVAESNKNEDRRFEGNFNDFDTAVTQYVQRIETKYTQIITDIEAIASLSCCLGVIPAPSRARKLAGEDIGASEYYKDSWRYKVHEMIKNADQAQANGQDDQQGTNLGVVPNYWKLQEDFFIAARERVNDDGVTGGGQDLYSDALTVGYKYNLYNSGFPVKMGEDSSEFYQWVDSLQPNNCTPQSYSWSDGAGRNHTVTATVCLDDFQSWEVNHTNKNRVEIETDFENADTNAKNAKNAIYNQAVPAYNEARRCALQLCILCDCNTPDGTGDGVMRGTAKPLMDTAMQYVRNAREGLRDSGSSQTVTSKNGTEEFIITDLEDINHSRTVRSDNFQFHQGGAVKGPRGDVDTPTFYPPVQSGANASFQGQAGMNGIRGKNPAHDVSLIGAN